MGRWVNGTMGRWVDGSMGQWDGSWYDKLMVFSAGKICEQCGGVIDGEVEANTPRNLKENDIKK